MGGSSFFIPDLGGFKTKNVGLPMGSSLRIGDIFKSGWSNLFQAIDVSGVEKCLQVPYSSEFLLSDRRTVG